MYDCIITGGGPAGVTAAVYCARAGLSVLLFEKLFIGGQAATTTEIENFPGHLSVSGADFAAILDKQLKKHEVAVQYDEVTGYDVSEKMKKVYVNETEYCANNLIIATGAVPKKLGVKGEAEFSGRGVSYCATCDGAFFKNKTVAVVGGGNTALNDCIYLSGICNKVYLIHRREVLRGDKMLQQKVKSLSNCVPLLCDSIEEICGDDTVNKLKLKSGNELLCDGLFVAIGTTPQSSNIPREIQLDDDGYIITDSNMETGVLGVYAIGDIRKNGLKQIVAAAADGAIAASSICKH